MDSSSSEFRYDGGEEVVGGGAGTWFVVGLLLGLAIMATILVLLFMYMPSTLVNIMPDNKLYWLTHNYTVTYDATADKYTRVVASPEVPIPTKPAAENLSVIWKDKMLSSGSDSAWGKSMYRGEGMCGQC